MVCKVRATHFGFTGMNCCKLHLLRDLRSKSIRGAFSDGLKNREITVILALSNQLEVCGVKTAAGTWGFGARRQSQAIVTNRVSFAPARLTKLGSPRYKGKFVSPTAKNGFRPLRVETRNRCMGSESSPPEHAAAASSAGGPLPDAARDLDRRLVDLLNAWARAECESGRAATAFVTERLDGLNLGPLSNDSLRAVFRELASGCRALGRTARVAFLGPAYTYSHLAALHHFGQSIEQLPVGSIAAVFEEVTRGHAEFGVVPVENSTDGRIADTLDMFTRLRVRICGEVPLAIHHSLLGTGPRGGITEVHSKPQALSQCRNWLARNLPQARLVEVASTVAAVQTSKARPEVAAIAGAQAATYYGVDVLAANIEDNTQNVTRFFVIGEESAAKTGRDKMSAMFEVPHKPGALADAMNIFKRYKLNLTWIESFPIARPEGGYLFFIELDGHETDEPVVAALAALEKKTLRLEVLGSYPRSEPVG
jgi:chorismate mutase/prephenate dehydratase